MTIQRTRTNLIHAEKALTKLVQQFFSPEYQQSNEKNKYWRKFGSFLEWRLMPYLTALDPAWPSHVVWCDGFEFFHCQLKSPNCLRAFGSSWWLPYDQGQPNDPGIHGGIEHSELAEIEIRLVGDDAIDYEIKLWANGLCHILTPSKIKVLLSCSNQLTTPHYTYLLKAIKERGDNGRRNSSSIAALLAGFGQQGAAYLAELLQNPFAEIRRLVTASFKKQGLQTEFTIPLIRKALQDSDLEVRHLAANGLWKRLQRDVTVVPLLQESTAIFLDLFAEERPRSHHHWYVDDILVFLGKLDNSVVASLCSYLNNNQLRHKASWVLWEIGVFTPNMKAVYQAGLNDDDLSWQATSAFSLWRFTVDDGKAMINITEKAATWEQLWPLNSLLSYQYNKVLALMPDERVLPVVETILQRRKTNARLWCQAALMLATLHERTSSLVEPEILVGLIPDLLHHLNNPDQVIQRYAIESLGKTGVLAKAVIPDLIAVLQNSDAEIFPREYAAKALICIQPDKEVVIRLFGYLYSQKNSTMLSGQALPMLKLLGNDGIAVLVAQLLKPIAEPEDFPNHDYYDYQSFDFLAEFGARSMPALIELSNHETYRLHAIRALGKTETADAVPALITFLQHPEHPIRIHAARALGQLGSLAKPAIAALTEAANDPDLEVCAWAMTALGEIGESAYPALQELQSHEDEFVRDWAQKTFILSKG